MANKFEAFYKNPVTQCYIHVSTSSGYNRYSKMRQWFEVSKEVYEDAIAKGWVEVKPGLLRPPTTPDELAPAQPATADAGEEDDRTLRTDLDNDTLERWPRLIWDRMTKPEFEGFYTDDHGRNDILDLLEVVSTLKAKLAAAEARADAFKSALEEIATNANGADPATFVHRKYGTRYAHGVEVGWYNAGLAAAKALQASTHGKGEAE